MNRSNRVEHTSTVGKKKYTHIMCIIHIQQE